MTVAVCLPLMQSVCIRCMPRSNTCTLHKLPTRVLIQQRCVSSSGLPVPLQRPCHGKTCDQTSARRFSNKRDVTSNTSEQQKWSRPGWKRVGAIIGLVVASKIVWDVGQWLQQNKEKDVAGSRTAFQSYTLIDKEPVSSTASIFHLQPTASSSHSMVEDALKQGIVNLEFKQPQIQVVRAYTPLPSAEPTNTLRFLIRQEPNGEVSSWLHRLPIGSQIEMRGPNYEFLMPLETRRIIFLAGGTGIAPALQAAHSLLQQPRTHTVDEGTPGNGKYIHILWASRRREECICGVSDLQTSSLIRRMWCAVTFQDTPASSSSSSPVSNPPPEEQGLVVRELESLKALYPDQVSVSYFVDEESTFITEDTVCRTLHALLSHPSSQSAPSPSYSPRESKPDRNSSSSDTQILVSGPDGFIAALAGPKVWLKGRQVQGPVEGVLGKVLVKQNTKGNGGLGMAGVYKI